MTTERDPLDELRAAWRAMAPPDPTASVDARDEPTRAAVAWMRSAWAAAAPPPTSALPWRVRLRIARPRVVRALPWVAAAAALVVCTALLGRGGRTEHDAAPVPELVARPEPIAKPELVSLSADRMELRSGPVRLILFTPGMESNR